MRALRSPWCEGPHQGCVDTGAVTAATPTAAGSLFRLATSQWLHCCVNCSCSVNEGGVYPHTYFSWGACCVEVELDVLTGEAEVLRADILYDCGQRYLGRGGGTAA